MKAAAQWGRRVTRAGRTASHAAALAIAAVVINSALVRPSAAQLAGLPQPEYTLKDENNVDLLSFNVYLRLTDVAIGAKEHPLTHAIHSYSNGGWVGSANAQGGGTVLISSFGDSVGVSGAFDSGVWASGAYPDACPPATGSTPYVTVRFAGRPETFAASLPGCASYSAVNATGSALTLNLNNYTYTYTTHDGTQIIFYCGTTAGWEASCQQLQKILYPDGRVLTYGYSSNGLPQSATRSDGLQFKYTWTAVSGDWTLTSVTAINNAYEYCAPTASTCSLQKTWPTATYSISTPSSGATAFTVTDAAGRVTRYTSYPNYTYGIKLPTSASADNITYTFCGTSSNWCSNFAAEYPGQNGYPYQGYVASVTRDGQTWIYSGNPGSYGYYQCGTATYGFTNPVGSGKQVQVANCEPNMYPADAPKPGFNPFEQLTNEDLVQVNAGNCLTMIGSVVRPEGNQTQYACDTRGNITQEALLPKSNSPLASVTLSANYPCTGTPVTCNEPTWVKDGLQNETDYTYDQTHGGVLTKTLPADSNGVRPQTTYTYTQRYAWVLNSSGAYVKSAAPIWVLATETFCRTSAATSTGCTVAGDQVVKTYEYGPDSGPNNLFLRGFAVTADGATHRTCYGHDLYGNRISETDADAGLTSCP
jgi:YD repeat-containing protein